MTDRILVHDHPEFEALLSIVSERRGVAAALVEKDYWVTHTLWALEGAGLQISFKGGTSLWKGFGLIERFSEDLDVKIEGPGLPRVRSWTSEGVRATEDREAFFRALGERLHVPGAEVAAGLTDNRPPAVRCVRPEVTLLEKVEAISRRYPSYKSSRGRRARRPPVGA